MAATIYGGIEGIEAPEITVGDFKEYQKACDKYIEDLRAQCKANSKQKYVGEIIKFGVADGYALYMVYSMKPLELIHIATMDAWHFQHVDLMTPERVAEMIENDKKIAELFKK